jgi:hypothetical protein
MQDGEDTNKIFTNKSAGSLWLIISKQSKLQINAKRPFKSFATNN